MTAKKPQVLHIERHDPFKLSSYLPWPVKEELKEKYWPPERVALLTPVYKGDKLIAYEGSVYIDMQWAQTQNRPWFGRKDIILINQEEECICPTCGCPHYKNVQHAVYPKKGGGLRGCIDLLSPEDLEWARDESRKCWELALKDELYRRSMYS